MNTNGECYIFVKMARLLGGVFIESQARLRHSPTVASLATSFGRGAMNNHYIDIKNSKCILIEGSNAAENHPLSMRWVLKAKENGAKVIHVDPRFTRTSAIADIHAQIRPSADIAFQGAIIKYVLDNNLYDEEYVKNYTNALFLVNPDFGFKDGLFSGYDEVRRAYDKSTWAYQLDGKGQPKKADDLNEENTVFSHLKKHFSRYDFETASKTTGIPSEKIQLIAETFTRNRRGTIMYALGMTQHTVGVQNIRCYVILQLLLGNIGKAGGGINALRGESNVQGSTDMCVLFHILPGYLSAPKHTMPKLSDWMHAAGTFKGKFLINLLKAWFGDAAKKENDFCYDWLPKRSAKKNYSAVKMFDAMIDGDVKFLYVMGQNPMVTNANNNIVREGLSNLDMRVVAELYESETAAFWKHPDSDPSSIDTEVILLPAATALEKEGSITNSGRWIQWRNKSVDPPGECKTDLEMQDAIFRKVRELYSDSIDSKDAPILEANWGENDVVSYEQVFKEINGYYVETGEPVEGIGSLKADGRTAAGEWIYSGQFSNGKNLAKRRDGKTDPSGLGLYPGWSFSWPANCRILYNRASTDINGNPPGPDRKLIWWDEDKKVWTGYDTPDIAGKTNGPDTEKGKFAFRMTAEGHGRLFTAPFKRVGSDLDAPPIAVSGTNAEGPMPEFYEPIESPTRNILSPIQNNPVVRYQTDNPLRPLGTSEIFPYVLCTSAVSEHWGGGQMTRNIPCQNELIPEVFVEMSQRVAAEKGIGNGQMVEVITARGKARAKAVVTNRIETLEVNGARVETIWMPYQWGFMGLSRGDSANALTIDAGDPNTLIPETKACLCNVRLVKRDT